MELKSLISECTKYDFKLILEEKNKTIDAFTEMANVRDFTRLLNIMKRALSVSQKIGLLEHKA